MTEKCSATTKAGNPCSRNAVGETEFCAQHTATEAVEAVETVITEATAEEMIEAAAEEVQGGFQKVQQRFEEILGGRSLNFSSDEYSPEKLLAWMRENIERINMPVISQLLTKLEDVTLQDLRNAETWKELWAVVNDAVRAEAQEAADRVTEWASPAVSDLQERLEQLPGVSNLQAQLEKMPTVSNLQERFEALPTFGESQQKFYEMEQVKSVQSMIDRLPGVDQGREWLNQLPGAATVNSFNAAFLEVAPKDLLEQETWSRFWSVVNESASEEFSAFRLFGSESVEDEIIEVAEAV